MGHRLLDSGVFGALALKHWLEGPLQLGAEPVVDGWGGDRYELLVDDDDQTLLFWRLLGDSDGDAAQIMHALRDRLKDAHGGGERVVAVIDTDDVFRARVDSAPEERRFIRTTRPEHLALERRGSAVVVVLGLAASADLDATVERLFVLAKATTQKPEDNARRVEVAATLEDTLDEALQALPPRAAPPLHDAIIAPARQMVFRLGADAHLRHNDDVGADVPSAIDSEPLILPAAELRWGVRPWLELSVPFGATFHGGAGPFRGAVTVAPRQLPLFSPHLAPWSGRALVQVIAASGDVGVVVQVDADVSASLTDESAYRQQRRGRVAALLRPLPGVLFMPGVEVADRASVSDVVGFGPDDDGFGDDGAVVRVGGVAQRGLVDAPLLQLELVRGLSLTVQGAALLVPEAPRGVTSYRHVETRIGVGALLAL